MAARYGLMLNPDRKALFFAFAGALTAVGCSAKEKVVPPTLTVEPTPPPEATAYPSPTWTAPTPTPTPRPTPTPEYTPTPEPPLFLPKHTLLVMVQTPDDKLIATAILPAGGRIQAPAARVRQYERPTELGPDGSWFAKVIHLTDQNGRSKSEVRVVRDGGEGTAGYSEAPITFADVPPAVSSVFDQAAYIVVVQGAPDGKGQALKVVENPPHHMFIAFRLPEWVKRVQGMAFSYETLYLIILDQKETPGVYALRPEIYHSLTQEQKRDCSWAINTLSECGSRRNQGEAANRRLERVEGLPPGTIRWIAEVVQER